MRRVHYLRDNKGNETPSQAIWFDTETLPESLDADTQVHRLRFGWGCYRRKRDSGEWTKPEWHLFRSKAEFWTWVDSRARDKKRLYLFCHNTNFDLPVLDVFGEMPSYGWTLKTAVIDGPPTILKYTKGAKTLVFLDTLNHFRMSLDELGRMIGVPKWVMPSDQDDEQAWLEYGKQDVEVIMRACMAWWSLILEHEFGNFAPTLAGQSLNAFRHKYMHHKVLLHDNSEVLALERASYHGGRCEAFKLGKMQGDFTLLDFTSMFPAVMRDHVFPAKLAFYQDNPHPLAVERYLPIFCSIALCELDTPHPLYGVVHDNRLVFPTGHLVTALTGPEIAAAIANEHLRRIIRIAFYEPAPLFREFVTELWRLRLEAMLAGNHKLAWFYKILMNSLYGKFGQRGMVWEEIAHIADLSGKAWADIDAETGIIQRYRQLGGLVQALSFEPEARESSPAIAAYVTALARLRLWDAIDKAGRENVYYCDTDSLLVNPVGLDRLGGDIEENALGKLKIEGRYREIEIHGPKDYSFGAKWKLKGARSGSVWTAPDTFQQEQWSGLKGQLRKGKLAEASTKLVVKRLRRVYLKGHVMPDGAVLPLKLDPSPQT